MNIPAVTLTCLLVVLATLQTAEGQGWLEKWTTNGPTGIKKRSVGTFPAPRNALEMIGFHVKNPHATKTKRSVDAVEPSTTMTTTTEQTTTTATVEETGAVHDGGNSAAAAAAAAGEEERDTMMAEERREETIAKLQRWNLMCSAFVFDQGADGLTLQTLQTAFERADKNQDGKIDSLELDKYEYIIEAYEICRLLQ